MPPIDEVRGSAFTIPTDREESDGTLEWDATTMIVVEVTAGGQRGLGYSYTEASAAGLVIRMLAPRVVGLDALAVPTAWMAMVRAVRNVGRAGVASGAIAAVDAALWDLKARLFGVALVDLLGPVRDGVEVYGSGGFTSYSTDEVAQQLTGWVEAGISKVKMKVGSDSAADEARVAAARTAIGLDAPDPHPCRQGDPHRPGPAGGGSSDLPGRHPTGPNADPWEGGAPARTPQTAPIYIPAHIVPRADDLARAAAVLNEGTKVVMLVGAGALGARDEVLAVTEVLASPVVKTLSGKAVVPDDHPLTTGGIGLLGTRPSEEAMESADTLFMVGTNFPYTKFLPEAGVRTVQIEADPNRAGDRIPTEVPLVGDAAETLQALLPLLAARDDRGFLAEAQDAMADWREKMATLEGDKREPIQPQFLMRVIDRLADDAPSCRPTRAPSPPGPPATSTSAATASSCSRATWPPWPRACRTPSPPRWPTPAASASPLSATEGSPCSWPSSLTAARYRLPIKVIINNNALLGQILWEQMALGFPEYGVRWEQAADYAPWAEACGGKGIRVEKTGEVEAAIAAALAHPGPALVDVMVNPDEPPMPAKITYEQAKGFASAFLHGQDRRASIASTIVGDKISQLKG